MSTKVTMHRIYHGFDSLFLLKLLLDLGKYYPQRGNLDGAKFKLLIMKFRP